MNPLLRARLAVINFFKRADPVAVFSLVASVCVILFLCVAALLSPTTETRTARHDDIDILVLKEFVVDTFDRGRARVVEYYVNGHAMNAVFYANDEEEYATFMQYLAALGRMNNAVRKERP